VGADAGELALGAVIEPRIEVRGDRHAEHAVAQELEPLVGARAVDDPGGVRESPFPQVGR
jgi:hypothetical protein